MRIRRALSTIQLTLFCLCWHAAFAGGPRWVAGSVYFNSSVQGQPIVWAGGQLIYYTDQGALSSYESNTSAASMVALAAAPWTQVPTASVSITQGGTLGEDVSGANVSGSRGNVVWPADVESAAKPVAVIYDEDGSVLNTVLGAGASDPSACLTNAVFSVNDGFSTGGNLTHAIIILNGLCANNANQVANMQYLLTREFGRVLGLDWSQANDNVWTINPPPTGQDFAGWPLMHPINVNCGGDSYSCVQNASALKMDDRAALGRLYPSSTFSTATVRVHGTISFAGGQGMQGVNVKATILNTKTAAPQTSSVVACVSGFGFRGNAGNIVTGTTDSAGNPLARFGSSVATVQGEYDVSGLEVPAGVAKGIVEYELTFEAINPLYTGKYAVGPELLGAPAPSGTLATIIVQLKAGENVEKDVTVTDSATGAAGIGGSFAAPNTAPATGAWQNHISAYGDTEWTGFFARPNRQLAITTTAMNESGAASQSKAMPVIGAWFADDAPSSPPDFSTSQAFDSSSEGVTMLEVATPAGDGLEGYPMVAAIADARGDGRPDYAYAARIFYADSVSPNSVPASGGVIAIAGTGFVRGDTVLVNGVDAPVLAISTEQIVVQAPTQNTSGAMDIQVNDPTGATALMSGALIYGSGGTSSAYALNVVSVPGGSGGSTGSVGAVAPGAFTVQVVDSNGNPVNGAPVTFSDSNGSLLSACGNATNCAVAASSGGIASTTLTPTSAGVETITASLANGVSAQASWTATSSGEAVQFENLPLEWEARQAAFTWPLTVTAVNNGVPVAGAKITWSVYQNNGRQATATTTTSSAGMTSYAAGIATLGAEPTADVKACLADGTCATIFVTGVSPDAPAAIALTGSSQTIAANATFAPMVLEITDGAIPGNPVGGVTVGFAESLYSYEPAGAGGKQPPPRLLAQSAQSAVSDTNGLVSLQPLQQTQVAGTVVISAGVSGRVVGTWTLLAEPTVAPVTGGPVARRRLLVR